MSQGIVSPNISDLVAMVTVSTIVSQIKKPLFPPLVHDDASRIIIEVIGILVAFYILYRMSKSLNG